MSRDRGTHCSEGAKPGAPKAKQVTDRLHVLVNLSETVHHCFLHNKSGLKEAMPSSAQPASSAPLPEREPWHQGLSQRQAEKGEKPQQQRVEHSHPIHELPAQ